MGSSLTWEDLSMVDLGPLTDLAASWTSHASTMIEQAERVTGDIVGGPLSADNFDSDTADECREQLGRLAGQFEDDIHDYASVRIAATLEELHSTLDAQQTNVKDLIDEVIAEDLKIQGDPGSEEVVVSDHLAAEIAAIEDDGDRMDRLDAAQEKAAVLETSLRLIMENARTADDEAAALLEGLSGEAAPMPPFLGSGYGDAVEAYEEALAEYEAEQQEEMLSGGADPHLVSGWWAGLTDDERAALIRDDPERIGQTDGIPSSVRSEVNMGLLDEYVADNPDDADAQELQDYLGLEENEDFMLLGFGAGGEGGMRPDGSIGPSSDWDLIVATGDPDQADNVAVYVPGTGSDASWNGNAMYEGTGTYLDFAQNINDAANGADRGANNVTVMWLDFDSPDGLGGAASGEYAENAAEELDRFTSGIAATNEGDPRITQIGHSYGGVVVGEADQYGSHNAADNVVLVGAPGPGADSGVAGNFNVGGDNTYVVHSDKDAVNAAASTHGADPRDEFGGNRVESANPEDLNQFETHMSYFGGNNPESLDSLGDIITGNPTTPHTG